MKRKKKKNKKTKTFLLSKRYDVLINLITLLILIILGLLIIIHGIFFKDGIEYTLQINIGLVFSLILTVPLAFLYLALKRKERFYLFFNFILQFMVSLFLIIFFWRLYYYNLIAILIGSLLTISSFIILFKDINDEQNILSLFKKKKKR